jgi:glycosyltransferase involved in cell wall biosynthesis
MIQLSLVIPFYNEEDNIEPFFRELLPVIRSMEVPFEVIAVNDGSTDQTAARLRTAMEGQPEIRCLTFARNAGQTAAFEAGFRAAHGELIVTLDGDLQIDPRDIPLMVDQLRKDDVDFVYGWRKERKDTWLKRLSTRVANAVRNRLTGESIPDTGCPLKVFKTVILKRMKLFNGMHRFFITLAHMDGWKSSQMIVRHRHRQHGKSKYGMWNRLFRSLRDCLAVRWMMKRHLKYQVTEMVGRGSPKNSGDLTGARGHWEQS